MYASRIATAACALFALSLLAAGCSQPSHPPSSAEAGASPLLDAAPVSKPLDRGAMAARERDRAEQRQRVLALRERVTRGGTEAADAIAEAVRDPGERVRTEAAYQLGHTKHPRAMELLEVLSHDPDAVVRRNVIEALQELGTDAARALLLRWGLADPDEGLPGTAARALAQMGGPGVEDALRKLARDHPDKIVRGEAQEALAEYLERHGAPH